MEDIRKILTPSERKSLEDNLDSILIEYKNKGSLRLESLVPIIGIPPSTSDIGSEEWKASAEYSSKIAEIESILKSKM